MGEMTEEQLEAKKQELLDHYGIDNNEFLCAPVIIHDSEVDPEDRDQMPEGYTLLDGGFWIMTKVLEVHEDNPVVAVKENPMGMAINLKGCVTRADVAAAVKKQWSSFSVRVEKGQVSVYMDEEPKATLMLVVTGKGSDWE